MSSTRIHRAEHNVHVPTVDLPTYIFSNSIKHRKEPQYFDADNPSVNFSLEQAQVWVKRWAKGIQDFGLKPNEKIMLFSGNSVYFPIMLWGVLASGCVFTGCSPGSSIDELANQMLDSDSVLLLADPALLSTAFRAADKAGLDRSKVIVFSPLGDMSSYSARTWISLWPSEEEVKFWDWRRLRTKEQAQSATAVINYSSGTTGLPKGVEISHYNMVANAAQVAFKRSLVGDSASGRERKQRMDISGERWLAPLPMFHAYGQSYYCTTAAIIGAKVFIMPKYDLQKYLLYLDIYRITFLASVPTLMVSIAKHPRASSYNLKAIEAVTTGSAPLNADIGKLVEEIYLRPGVQVKQGWGLTENAASATSFAPDDRDDGRSVGRLNPNMSAKVVPQPDFGFESDGSIPYTIGEIWLAGPNIMMGYYNRPEQTAATIVVEGGERWLRTGDIGYIDEEGRIYIVDHAAVVGERRQDGEYPKAFVVAQNPEHPPTEKEIQKFIEDRLSKHKWLTAGVGFLDAIPRTASGKVMRRMLPGQTPQGGVKAKL
ncbi:unnamed protein product [Clonostachys rosea]|uniref:AMP-dependent synthetase/ligase domain-containing protein n=1 Tax=Bionectria ochroleuca TaxID=29856 RepID=A0ABY6U6S8_BIOOC|nr:unnamed protein product [Clonostachys rosea]